MPRKKQVVQKQKRIKAYRPGELSGDVRHVKPKGVFRVFSNYKLFAIIGAAALTVGLLISAFRSSQGGATNNAITKGQVIRSTPEAGQTSTTGAQATIKQYTAAPPMTIDTTKTYTATFTTDKGDIVVQLDAKSAPEAVNNFVFLAKDGYYNGSSFFRVIADASGTLHYAQAGDPTGTGSGGPGYDLPFEATSTKFDQPGVLAVAKPSEAGAANNGSQFFFSLQPEPTLDGKFTAFGQVTTGLNVLDSLTPRDPAVNPNAPISDRIQSVAIAVS